MGCLLGCFGRRKNRRRQRRREPRLNKISEESTKDVHLNLVEEVPKSAAKVDHLNFNIVVQVPKISEVSSAKDDHLIVKVPAVEEVTKVSVIPTTDICDKKAEEKKSPSPSPSPSRKRVTFDSKVKTYEHIAVDESIELFEEKKKEEVVKPGEKPLNSRLAPCSSEGSDVASNSSGSYPSNHRYQNCRESDDEEVDDVTDCDESDLDDIYDDDDDDDGDLLDEDYYNDDDKHNWDNKVYTEEIADNVLDLEKSNTSARDRSGYVNAVLNPIENLTQWKAVKSKGRTTQTQPRKENVNRISDQEHKLNASFCLEEPRVDELPSFSNKQKSRDEIKKQRPQEVAVDASLSTWLSTAQIMTSGCSSSASMGIETAMSEKKKHTSNYSKPVQRYDERPILGALTSEEIKLFSAKNSPRKSPSRSPESPIIGTVGGYWNNHSMATRR